MTKKEQAEIVKVLTGLAVWFGQQVSEDRITMYVKHLEPYDYDIILDRLKEIKVLNRFFPQMCEILQTRPDSPELEYQAVRDWMWLRSMRELNAEIIKGLSLESQKYCLALYKDMGGAFKFGKWDIAIEHLKMAEFIKKYQSLRQAETLSVPTETFYIAPSLY